jgi:hypothetical protein
MDLASADPAPVARRARPAVRHRLPVRLVRSVNLPQHLDEHRPQGPVLLRRSGSPEVALGP